MQREERHGEIDRSNDGTSLFGIPVRMWNRQWSNIINHGSVRKGGIRMNMDEKALSIVREYIKEHLDKSEEIPDFEVFTV